MAKKIYKVKIDLTDEVVAEIAKLGYTPEDYFTVIVTDLLKRYTLTASGEVLVDNEIYVKAKTDKAKDGTKVEKG